MADEPYYMAYEKRYKAVFDARAKRWGHSPDDTKLRETLAEWVLANNLVGKRVIEFACGEGACGEILSEMGCVYRGVDVSPTVVERARAALSRFPNARIDLLDMVNQPVGEVFDAALDCMGLHMLVTDADRRAYLKNAGDTLRGGSPMLFFREAYTGGQPAYRGAVNSYEEWVRVSGSDYASKSARRVDTENGHAEVMIPLVPARANDKAGYIAELRAAGFAVEKFTEMDSSSAINNSASIYARKE